MANWYVRNWGDGRYTVSTECEKCGITLGWNADSESEKKALFRSKNHVCHDIEGCELRQQKKTQRYWADEFQKLANEMKECLA